jgi:uncharacterized protein (TIGR02444 family)
LQAPAEPARKQTSAFWKFSLKIYPSIADTCLELQDGSGVDVNVLLFLLWAAHDGRKVSPGEVHLITSAVASWNKSVVAPLRSVRRFLRTPPNVIDSEAAAALRQHVKQIELEAERLQQEALYRFLPLEDLGTPEPSRDAAARSNMRVYAAKLGTDFPEPLIAALLKVFRKLDRPAED